MKKGILLTVVGLLSFAAGTAGIFLAMPSIAPDVVDSTRVRLDSLSLVAAALGDRIPGDATTSPSALDSLAAMAADSSDTLGTRMADGKPEISLEDSLRRTTNLNAQLKADNESILDRVEELTERLERLEAQNIEAAELTKSLSTLEEQQLGSILGGLDMDVLRQLYVEASSRERSRLLQNMPADRAAQFVRTLMGAPDSVNDEADQDDMSGAADASPSEGDNAGLSNP